MVLGTVESIPASQFVGSNPSAGDLVYMSTTVGKLTVDIPTGSARVQNVGVIAKTNVNVSGNSGTANILVQGPGRTTDLDTVRTVTAGGNTLADSETLAFTAGSNVTISESAGAVTIASTDTNTFRTVTAGGNTLGASETLAFTAGSNVTISESAGAVTIASTDTNTFRTVTAGGNTLGASETLAFTAGSNITITESGGAVTIAASGGGSGASVAFKTIAVAGQSNVVADAADDTLTLVAGTNVTLTTNAGSDSVTITSSDTDTTDAAIDIYTPGGAAAGSWAAPPPATVAEALDRIAIFVTTLIPGAPPQIP